MSSSGMYMPLKESSKKRKLAYQCRWKTSSYQKQHALRRTVGVLHDQVHMYRGVVRQVMRMKSRGNGKWGPCVCTCDCECKCGCRMKPAGDGDDEEEEEGGGAAAPKRCAGDILAELTRLAAIYIPNEKEEEEEEKGGPASAGAGADDTPKPKDDDDEEDVDFVDKEDDSDSGDDSDSDSSFSSGGYAVLVDSDDEADATINYDDVTSDARELLDDAPPTASVVPDCPICLERMTVPIAVGCGHIVCLQCLIDWAQAAPAEDALACVKCRTEVTSFCLLYELMDS